MIRLVGKLLILLFCVALLLAIFAPSFLSTKFGQHAIFRLIKSFSGYQLQADQLQLRWLGGQTAEKVEVIGPSGRPVFQAETILSSASLWQLLFYHDVGRLEVTAPLVWIEPPPPLAAKLAICQAGFFFSFSLPFPMHFLGEISVTHGGVQFGGVGLDLITMKEIELEASILPRQLKVKASGSTEELSSQKSKGTFQVDLLAYPGSDQIDASAELSDFPLRAADQLVSLMYPKWKGIILDAIGETVSAQLRLKNLQNVLDIYLNANSDLFSAHLETKIQEETLVLASPGVIQFQVPAKAFKELTSLSLKDKMAAQIKIDELLIPLQHRAQFTLQGTLKSEPLQFEDWTLDPFSLLIATSPASEGEWSVKIDSPQIQFHGSVHLPEDWENLSVSGQALLPKNTTLDISAPSLKSISVVLQGDHWHGRLKGAFDPIKKTVSLNEPASLAFELSNSNFLKEPLPIQISLHPFHLNLQTLSGTIKGSAEAPPFLLGTSHVDQTTASFHGDLKNKQAFFSLASKVDQGPLMIEGSVSWPWQLTLKGSCSELPIASIQSFLPRGPSLPFLLGNVLTTDFHAALSENTNFLQLTASSPLLKLKAILKATSQQFELTEPATFLWTLTPQGYTSIIEFLKGNPALALSQPVIFKGSIESLTIPLQKDLSLDQLLNDLQYQGKMSADTLAFSSNRIDQLQINLSHPSPTKPHQFQLSATAAPQGSLSCQGSWTPPGTANLTLLLDRFPSAAFDFFIAPLKKDLFSMATLCGPVLNLSAETTLNQWTGPVKLDLHSANLRTSLQGALTQGVLTLTNPFHLQLDVTPAVSQMLFQQMNPLSLKSVQSEGPITLEISPQGFSYPLSPHDISHLEIGAGRLELGKLLCRNEGNIQVTLGLLKLGQYHSGDELKLWAAPLIFHVQHGILDCERTEILVAENFQICLWGAVDFPDNSIDAVLGLTASCLKNAFGIKGLPENYVLQLPLRGTLTDAKINSGKAGTKIGALLLWQQKGAVGGIAKGPAGALLGEMINKLGPLPGGDQKAPPAKHPFPWETKGGSKETKQPSSKKKNTPTSQAQRKVIHPNDSAVKQALKLLR